jgi:uncharacterized protein
MELNRELPTDHLFVRSCEPHAITVVDRRLTGSFVLTPGRVVEDWPVADAATLTSAALAAIVQLDPEVVLLGTGAHQVFPPRDVLAELLRRGIGVEVMDNAAASRTYNVLASEGRRVAAAFVLAA